MQRAERVRTAIRSFRLDEEMLQVLEVESRRRKVSVNTLVNQILLGFVSLDRFLEPLGMVKVSSDCIRDLLESASEAAVLEAGTRTGANTMRSVILTRRGTLDLEPVIEHLKTMGEFGRIFQYSETSNGSRRTITLVHRWGKKGSVYLSGVLTSAFGAAGIKPKLLLTDNSVAAVL